jgi:hypothetical protein
MKKPIEFDMELSSDIIWEIWAKGEIFAGNDPVFWRKDACGAWIFRGHYGRQDSEYGWVIDRIKPMEKDDTDTVSNLRPVQWENTLRKADGSIECRVTSTGVHNDKPLENNIVIEPVNVYIMNY